MESMQQINCIRITSSMSQPGMAFICLLVPIVSVEAPRGALRSGASFARRCSRVRALRVLGEPRRVRNLNGNSTPLG